MRCSDRPYALPRSLSRIDRAEARARSIDVDMDARVIEAGDGVDFPVGAAAADWRTRRRQFRAELGTQREIFVDGQSVLECERGVAAAVRGTAVERTLPVVGIGCDQDGPAFVPCQLERHRR